MDMFSRLTAWRSPGWRAFASEVRGTQEKLLVRLEDFQDSVLVTGCQRSGGTMLSRVITQSDGMVNYWFGADDELDAALILAGRRSHEPTGRYCFQTTYLNERYPEYVEHTGHRIVWSLRNPHSVVYSMLYNWRRFALKELFLQCGYGHMNYRDRVSFQRYGLRGVSAVRRAAYAYVGKVSQVFFLKEHYPPDRLTVLEYDTLVRQKSRLLPALYQRIDLPYKETYAEPISERSLGKKGRLTPSESAIVDEIASPVFERALSDVDLK